MFEHKLMNSAKSYWLVAGLGFAAGVLTVLLDFFPPDTLWTWSSFSGCFGFWIVTTTILIFLSDSRKVAGWNAFIYLSSMSIAFYLSKAVVYKFVYSASQFELEFLSLTAFWLAASAICGLSASFVWIGQGEGWWPAFWRALPIAGLIIEATKLVASVIVNQKYLAQAIFDIVFAFVLFFVLNKNRSQKSRTFVFIVPISALVIFLVYKTGTLVQY